MSDETNETMTTGEMEAVRLVRVSEIPGGTRSAVWQPPPIKRSTLISTIVGALAIVGGLSGGTSYLGQAQHQDESTRVVEATISTAIGSMERKNEDRARRIEDKIDTIVMTQDSRMERIESQIGELKLDVRDIRRQGGAK